MSGLQPARDLLLGFALHCSYSSRTQALYITMWDIPHCDIVTMRLNTPAFSPQGGTNVASGTDRGPRQAPLLRKGGRKTSCRGGTCAMRLPSPRDIVCRCQPQPAGGVPNSRRFCAKWGGGGRNKLSPGCKPWVNQKKEPEPLEGRHNIARFEGARLSETAEKFECAHF